MHDLDCNVFCFRRAKVVTAQSDGRDLDIRFAEPLQRHGTIRLHVGVGCGARRDVASLSGQAKCMNCLQFDEKKEMAWVCG